MLVQLAIRDLVLIERAVLEPGPGLTVLTGETGAGKSILLDGLGLALGDRADATLVRAGTAQASVAASFMLAPGHPAHALLADNDVEPAEPLVVRRVVRADGGSRAYVNDTPVSAGLLRQLGSLLVEVHGQHDERGLLAPRGHLDLLDSFAGTDRSRVAAAWARLQDACQVRDSARARLELDRAEREFLAHALDELRRLDPKPGEEAELADRRRRMQEGARLAEALDALDRQISGPEGALALLRQAARRLERLGDADPALAGAVSSVDRMLVEGDSLESALAAARRRWLISPADLEAAEARLFDLRAAARKHRVTPEELPGLVSTLARRLDSIEAGEATLARLDSEVAAASAAFAEATAELAIARAAAAEQLDRAVNAELPALRLDSARFRTRLTPAEPGATGTERAEFEVETNPGSGFGALTRIASGGELSRFVLALKVALARAGTAGTLVFDEIDRGVGGATASAIGSRLARVAETAQVLVVTHSPQVAAAGRGHFRIHKADGRTGVAALDQAARVEEIARMLSGTEITAEARMQAERLLAHAAARP
ncbi:DNA repair protein RecN [Thermaurantiacus sp.]